MGLGQKSVCKAPESSVVKGLIYAGIKRVRVSWPEVWTQFTPQSRDRRFGRKGNLAWHSPHPGALQRYARTLERRGYP